MTVAILGGGVAGLAAAYRHVGRRPGEAVHVIEGADRLGGLAVVWKNGEFRADLGPHRIYTELPEIEALLPELIARDRMLDVPRRSQLLLGGHFYRYPVSAMELLRVIGPVGMAPLVASAVVGRLRGAFAGGGFANYEDRMSANFGRRVYDLIVAPYTRKVWKIEPAELSDEVARVRVSAGNAASIVKQLLGNRDAGKKGTATALARFGYIKGGVEGLVHALRDKAAAGGTTFATDRRVTGFRLADGDPARVAAVTLDTPDGPSEHAADWFVSTLPVTDLVGMMQKVSPDKEAADAASKLVYIGLILVGLVVKRTKFTDNSWIYFPEEKYVFNRAYEPRNFDPSMAPADRSLAVFEVTARWDSELWAMPQADLIARVRADAISTGLVTEADLEDAFALKVPHTYPLYTTDFQANLTTVLTYLARFKNLVSTGRQGLFNHNNMDHSMLMGLRAADAVADAAGQDGQAGDAAVPWLAGLHRFADFRIVD